MSTAVLVTTVPRELHFLVIIHVPLELTLTLSPHHQQQTVSLVLPASLVTSVRVALRLLLILVTKVITVLQVQPVQHLAQLVHIRIPPPILRLVTVCLVQLVTIVWQAQSTRLQFVAKATIVLSDQRP